MAALCAGLAVWAATSEVSAAGITCGTALHEPDQQADAAPDGTYDQYFPGSRPALSTVCDSGRTVRQLTAVVGAAGALLFGGAALTTAIRRRGTT